MKGIFNQLFLVLTYGGIIQGMFIALLLNSKGVRRSRANLFLSILLLALSFSLAHILFAGAVITHFFVPVYSIGDPTYYLIAPLLWFYTCELTGQRLHWSWKLLLHFLPFFIVIIFSLTLRSPDSPAFHNFIEENHRLVNIFFWITVVVQFSWYQVSVQQKWRAYQRFIQQEVSNTENVSLSWVRFFLLVFLVINFLFFLSLFVVIHRQNGSWLPIATAGVFSISIFALGYKGILQKEIFQKHEEKIPIAVEETTVAFRQKTDPARITLLKRYMDERKPYLDAELTLTSLAEGMGMTRSQLSQLVNDGIGDNFYDFVNKYRVEQVKKLMVDPQMKNYNMLGIALEAGFKSKSTFNLIFKRFTGLTPTEYRKNISA